MYRIESCTLTGYRRMQLNGIREITITPKSAIQLILGANGSGKSSFLEQLTPLPADGASFIKGGGKVVTVFKDGLKYICTSRVDHGTSHSFVCEGEELNPGGTERVQRELCYKHFRVNQKTHDLMRGVEKFHNMSNAKRREWFTEMCDVDYTFAMDAYEKLKDHSNALTNAIKINRKHLVNETAKIMSEAEETKLEYEVGALLSELNILQQERAPVLIPSDRLLATRDETLRAIDEMAQRVLRNRIIVPLAYNDGRVERDEWGDLKKVEFTSVDEIDQEIDRLKHAATSNEATLVTLHEEFNKRQRQHDILVKTGNEGFASLKERMQELQRQRQELLSKMRLGLVFTNGKALLASFEAIEMDFASHVEVMPENTDRRLGRARLQTLQESHMAINNRLKTAQEHLLRLSAKKEHADLHRGETKHQCPQCHHSWVVGVNEEKYQALLAEIVQAENHAKGIIEEQTTILAQIKEIEDYFSHYREIMQYTRTLVGLKDFWDHLQESNLLLDAPKMVMRKIAHLKEDLLRTIEIDRTDEQITETTQLMLAAEQLGETSLNKVREEMDEISERLGHLTSNLARVNQSISDYAEYRRQLMYGINLSEQIQTLLTNVEDQQLKHLEALRLESINECLGQIENALALKQESLRSVKMQKSIVARMKQQLESDEVREQAAKAAVAAISPINGLIAEGLLGFINNFVGQMNAFIAKIWTYPLQVIPTGFSKDLGEQTAELDYKFKMVVEREDNIIPDVKLGSEGIKEIVDLSFMLVALEQLGLTDTPLMLDEFGKSLDDQHRFEAVREISWMMENGNHPQLFMISHYVSNYSAFTDAEICVIDERNIVIPAGREFNQHVKILN